MGKNISQVNRKSLHLRSEQHLYHETPILFHMRSLLYKRITLILLLISGLFFQTHAMEGVGVYFKVSLSGQIYKHLSFLLEEDVRPQEDFKRMEWFLTTAELNYKINPYFLAGGGYMSLAHYDASKELRNRYYFYATASYPIGRFNLSLRERFQSTFKVHTDPPKNYLRSMLNVSYRIGKSRFSPFVYAEVFNDTMGKMRAEKLRLSTGSNYKLNKHNSFQLYYRYNTYNVEEPVNYRHCIGVCYSHQF